MYMYFVTSSKRLVKTVLISVMLH